MLAPLLALTIAIPSHLIGAGGLIGPPQPEYMVGRDGVEERRPVHGRFMWEYGIGLEEWLTDDERLLLTELRNRYIALTASAAACIVAGNGLTALGLFITPNFVNVEHPDPGGLTVPIILASVGAVISLVAVPLVVFAPTNNELETIVFSHNSNAKDGDKLLLVEEVARDVKTAVVGP
ncbi:MAG: hypothetical protein JXR83_03120 [Deltaproteobacteria bacterium]|nr:hypothetical protein [Deltaproteobacteria bacterium]